MKKRIILFCSVIVELIIVILSVIMYQPMEKVDFRATDLICHGGYYNAQSDAVVINQESAGDGWTPGAAFAQIEFKVPHAGIYVVDVEYLSSSEDSHLCVIPAESEFGAMKANDAILTSNNHHATLHVWIKQPDLQYLSYVTYRGDGNMQVNSISVRESKITIANQLFKYSLFFIFLDIIIWWIMKGRKRFLTPQNRNIYLGFGIAVLAASYPLLTEYLIAGDDLYFHLLRIEEIKDSIKQGIFPLKMHMNTLNGYGYPTSIFYGNILLYLPALLRLFGFPLQVCYLCYVIFINMLTIAISFYCFKGIIGDTQIACIGSILYTLSYYRIVNIYVRSAVGEYSAMAFYPLIIYGFYLIFSTDEKREFRRASYLIILGLSGIIQTHLLSGEMLGIFIILTCVIFIRKTFSKQRFLCLLKTFCLTLLFNLWFLLPMLESMRQDITVSMKSGETAMIQNQGTFLAQLLLTFTDGNGSSLGADRGIPSDCIASLGASLLLGIIVYLFWNKSIEEKKYNRFGNVMFLYLIIALGMTTIYFPYDYFIRKGRVFKILFGNIQYPWRFLAIATLCAVVLTLVGLRNCKMKDDKVWFPIMLVLMLMVSVLTNAFMLDSILRSSEPVYVYDAAQIHEYEIGEADYLLNGVDTSKLIADRVIVGDNVYIEKYSRQYDTISIFCENRSGLENYVEVPFLNYISYVAECAETGEKLVIESGENNVVRVILPTEFSGTLTIRWKEPLHWRLSEACSFICLLSFVVFAQLKGKKREYEKTH